MIFIGASICRTTLHLLAIVNTTCQIKIDRACNEIENLTKATICFQAINHFGILSIAFCKSKFEIRGMGGHWIKLSWHSVRNITEAVCAPIWRRSNFSSFPKRSQSFFRWKKVCESKVATTTPLLTISFAMITINDLLWSFGRKLEVILHFLSAFSKLSFSFGVITTFRLILTLANE